MLTARRQTAKGVAIHEAGHLFANLSLAPSPFVDAIWISRSKRGRWEGAVEYDHRFQWALADITPSGSSEWVETWQESQRENARREILVSLAGPVAEIRWRLRGRAQAWFAADANAKICLGAAGGEGSDLERVRRYIDWLGLADPHAAFVQSWLEAEALVHRHWLAIKTVAALLKLTGRIEAEELYGLPVVASARAIAPLTG